MTKLLEQLLDAPDVKLLIREVTDELKKEDVQRKAFYDWIREDQKAEFINGEVILHSPVMRRHWRAVSLLSRLLSIYAEGNDLGEVATEKAMVSLTRNDYEPDVCFWGKDKAAKFDGDTMRHPAPDFVVEVLSKGTAQRDRGIKMEDYAAHGVSEYWLINPIKQEIEQYLLGRDKEFILKGKFSNEEIIESQVIAGFKILAKAIFDEKENFNALRNLIK